MDDCGVDSHESQVRSIKRGGVLGFWTPHHLHQSQSMSIICNAYKLPNCPSTISRHDTRVYNCGRIDASVAYPSCKAILAHVLVEQEASDLLEECHNCDALFGFTIRGHLDRVVCRGRLSNNHILDCIVHIGLYNWSGLDRQWGGKQPPIQIHYAAVMGMQLWKRIDVLSDQVSLLYISLQCEIDREFRSAIPTKFGIDSGNSNASSCQIGLIG